MARKKIYETIIIGGGISGLACARTLQDNKKSFIMVTPNIGGRILTSKDKKVNYGAYLISSYYEHIKKYVIFGRPIFPQNLELHFGKKKYHLLNWDLFLNIGELFRFYRLLYRFSKEYKKLRIQTVTISQKEAIQNNEFLFDLYKQSAKEFIKKHKIENIVNKFIAELIYAITFSSVRDGAAFPFLHACLLLHSDMHEFKFNIKKITKGFKKKIRNDEIKSCKRKSCVYTLKGKSGKSYLAKNVVIATPIQISKRLLGLKKINKPINAHMFHIKGVIKENWKPEEFQLFSANHNICVIAHQNDGTFLVYSKKKPNLGNYFKQYQIIYHMFWRPAFMVPGPIILECEQKENLYMIGDYNLSGMEDSFITGVYAANQIIKNS